MGREKSSAPNSPLAQGLSQNLAKVHAQIASAVARSGRTDAVQLLVVGKQQPASALRTAAALGQSDFGESYLQEALDKQPQLADLPLVWHFVGQIQSNKTRPIAEHFQWVHTLDRLKIAQRLNEQRPHYAAPLQVCIQVKLADEAGKGGVWPQEVTPLARQIAQLPRLRLRGLMCIPPPSEHFDEQRRYFDQAAALLEQLKREGFAVDTLSMGMSDDLEAAVASGATIVRVGTAIFGERK